MTTSLVVTILAGFTAPTLAFDLVMGTSWDSVSLQDVLDAEYGVGAIDVDTDYEGYHPADAVIPYWEDDMLDGVLIREIAGYSPTNEFGWYEETLGTGPPSIDGINDGVVFDGSQIEGAVENIDFPGGVVRFGFYLNPNGNGDSTHAPEPEMFFTNRFYNDIGPSGAGTNHLPSDGDPQCLVFNITHLRNGHPTMVLAWEDLDYGSPLNPSYIPGHTDNDFQDLVVEISAASPVKTVASSFGKVKALYDR